LWDIERGQILRRWDAHRRGITFLAALTNWQTALTGSMDGTIKMFAYLVLLYDPAPHALVAVEEPENQLYPELLLELVEEFRDYARRGGQVFISTHSPDFLNGTKLEEIYWLVKEGGFAMADIVRATYYITDLADADAFFAVCGEVFGEIRPATTLLVVAGLYKPEMRIEIEVTAKRRAA
jgi:hypothetical protein